MVLYLVLLFAVMVVRGKPYGAEQLVSTLFPKKACCSSWIGPLLAFTWNVVSDQGTVSIHPGASIFTSYCKENPLPIFPLLLSWCQPGVWCRSNTSATTGSDQSQHSRNLSRNCFIATRLLIVIIVTIGPANSFADHGRGHLQDWDGGGNVQLVPHRGLHLSSLLGQGNRFHDASYASSRHPLCWNHTELQIFLTWS